MEKELTNLNARKPLGLSELLAWALREGCNEIFPHLSFLINEYVRNNMFHLKLKKSPSYANI